MAQAAAHAPHGWAGQGEAARTVRVGGAVPRSRLEPRPPALGRSARSRAALASRLPSRGLARALPPTPRLQSPLRKPVAPCLRLQKESWRPKLDTRPPVLTSLHFVSGRGAGAGQDRGPGAP